MSPLLIKLLTIREWQNMKERMYMSIKELSRLEVLNKVHEKRITQRQAAEVLGLSLRHVKRLSKALKLEGPKGLISKKFGSKGNNRVPDAVKSKALGLILAKYHDFSPTLAHEYLIENHDLQISVSTIRNLMIEHKIWTFKQKRKKRVFQLRPRRAQRGELVQLDGSDHEWFEQRAPRCTLLVYADDATGELLDLRFVPSESTKSYFKATKEYLKKHGRPQAFYTDKHTVFRVNRDQSISEGITQFGRAMKELDIDLICANTPQAKGRVERRNRDLQNRLVKALRLSNISSIEEANAYLSTFIKDFNKRFAIAPQNPLDAHRPLLNEYDLDLIFSLQSTRTLTKNLIFQYNSTIYQVITNRETYAMRKRQVTVTENDQGKISVSYKGHPLRVVPYNETRAQAKVVTAKELSTYIPDKKPYKPSKFHPWKRNKRGFAKV